MWRDPLDELIADLERSMPAAGTPIFDMPPMEDVILMFEVAMSQDPEQRRLLAADPRIRRAWEHYQRAPWARRSSDPGDPDE